MALQNFRLVLVMNNELTQIVSVTAENEEEAAQKLDSHLNPKCSIELVIPEEEFVSGAFCLTGIFHPDTEEEEVLFWSDVNGWSSCDEHTRYFRSSEIDGMWLPNAGIPQNTPLLWEFIPFSTLLSYYREFCERS